jgi:hypothetical protein
MSSEEHELRWYLMSTKRGKEVPASKALDSVCAEVFLPLIYQSPGGQTKTGFSGLHLRADRFEAYLRRQLNSACGTS